MRPVLFLALAAAAAPALAQWEAAVEQRLTPAYGQCQASGAAAQGVTSAMMDCLGAENERQDARLNEAYRIAMKRLPAARQAELRQLQRAWIKQRDAAARAAGDQAGGGSAAGLEYAGTFLHETVKRTIWLEEYR